MSLAIRMAPFFPFTQLASPSVSPFSITVTPPGDLTRCGMRETGRELLLLEDVGEVAATAVLAVLHGGHEDTGTAL